MNAVYIHIPFCRTRCPYCDFVSEAVLNTPPNAYINALVSEIDAFDPTGPVHSLFFGGGTPSLLEERQLARILEAVQKRFSIASGAEITLEANPDDIQPDTPRGWRNLGINRISIGIQSFDDQTLQYLGRRHNAAAARLAIKCVSSVFDNWSMDLIFGAKPDKEWSATLAETLKFRPPHLSVYGLTYEPGTPFGKSTHEALDEDAMLEKYRHAEQMLPEWTHYEISNYARHGFECRHNLVYWHNEEYAGFGTGAYSFLKGVRSRNHSSTQKYLIDPGGKEEQLHLAEKEVRVETVIQHLRLRSGISRSYYRQRFGAELEDDFGDILKRLATRGLLAENDGVVAPTEQGFYLNNEIGLELVD